MPIDNIPVGSFVAAKHAGTCCGFVRSCGSIPFGRGSIRGYTIIKANGSEDFIPEGEVVLIALPEGEEE